MTVVNTVWSQLSLQDVDLLFSVGTGQDLHREMVWLDRLCVFRGHGRVKNFFAIGDVVLVGVRNFVKLQPDEGSERGDVIHKYRLDEVMQLIELGEIPNISQMIVTTEEGTVQEKDGEEDNEDESNKEWKQLFATL